MTSTKEYMRQHIGQQADRNMFIYKPMLKALLADDKATFVELLRKEIRNRPESFNINYTFRHPYHQTFLDIAICNGQTEFIDLLLEYGANPNRVNENHNRAPIHFAVDCKNAEALSKLLKNPSVNPNLEMQLGSGITALHVAVKNDDLECARLLLEHNASPNIPNSKGASAMHLAASTKNRRMIELIFAMCPNVDIDTFKGPRRITAREYITNDFPDFQLPPKREMIIDSNLLQYYLQVNDEKNFLDGLKAVDNSSLKNTGGLLKIAAKKNLKQAFQEILRMESITDVTTLLDVAEEVVTMGNPEILQEILDYDGSVANKLLIRACAELDLPSRSGTNNENNRLSCLKLILEHEHVNVRCEDDKGNTPLHYAARAGCEEAMNLLLHRGSHIGHANVFGTPPLAHIPLDVLSKFLDECLESKVQQVDDFEVIFRYDCLEPHEESRDNDEDYLLNPPEELQRAIRTNESETLRYIAEHNSLKPLLRHPVLSSFLYLKWHRIRYCFYLNVIFYLLFYLVFNVFIVSTVYNPFNSTESTDASRGIDQVVSNVKDRIMDPLYLLTFIFVIILTVRELSQLVASPCTYFRSFENWLDIFLITLGIWMMLGAGPQVGAVANLLSAWKLVVLIGHHPSLSIHVQMFRTVTRNFLKFLVLYVLLIIAFANAFFMIFRQSENANFPHPGLSLFKTIVMLTGEFDSGDLPFVAYPILSHCIFLGFVFFIAIVMMNLLAGLAVSDTSEILAKAELYSLVSQAKMISQIENIVVGSARHRQRCLFCCRAWSGSACLHPLRFLARKVLLFPQYLPAKTLSVKPYKGNEVIIRGKRPSKYLALRMSPSIVEMAMKIISNRDEDSIDEKYTDEFVMMKRKFERIEEMLEQVLSNPESPGTDVNLTNENQDVPYS